MSAERVDKGWHEKGIETYSNAALFTTLAHYGVSLSQDEFLALTKQDFPLGIAQTWHARWKGTGQFSRFPAAAAEELWRRFNSEEIAPTDLTLALINLLTALDAALEKKDDDGTLDTRFKVVEGYVPRVPPEGERHEKFMAELVGTLGEWMDALDQMAVALATEKHADLADRFVKLEEALFPVRAGSASALVKAAKGDKDAALAELKAIAANAQAEDYTRLSAIDGLFDLEALDDAKRFTLELVDRAEREKDVELASEVVARLSGLLEADPKRSDRKELRARVEQLSRVLDD